MPRPRTAPTRKKTIPTGGEAPDAAPCLTLPAQAGAQVIQAMLMPRFGPRPAPGNNKVRSAWPLPVLAAAVPHVLYAQSPPPSLQPGTIIVVGAPREDTPAKLDHISPEVDGTKITVTKKTSVAKLDLQPTVIDNDQRRLFIHLPGLLVTDQQTPAQFNLSYRGLGNPQESEYVLALQDGLPISTDPIGFPTLYYEPLPQGVAQVELVRGGSGLLYGPNPAPALNFVSKRPKAGEPIAGYSENMGGSDGLFSSYNAIEGTSVRFEFRGAFVRL